MRVDDALCVLLVFLHSNVGHPWPQSLRGVPALVWLTHRLQTWHDSNPVIYTWYGAESGDRALQNLDGRFQHSPPELWTGGYDINIHPAVISLKRQCTDCIKHPVSYSLNAWLKTVTDASSLLIKTGAFEGSLEDRAAVRAPVLGCGSPRRTLPPHSPLSPPILTLERVLIKKCFKDSSAEAPFLISTPY